MFKKISFFFISLFSFCQLPAYQTCNSIDEILKEVTDESMVFIDLDDTLIDYSTQMGKSHWRRYIRNWLKSQDAYHPYNVHDLSTLLIARKVPVSLVEEKASAVLRTLQEKKIPTFGLTARKKDQWYETPVAEMATLTNQQLNQLGIDFSLFSSPYDFSQSPNYDRGVFYAGKLKKGDFLKQLFIQSGCFPKKVIFIDDYLDQAQNVEQAMAELGIPCAAFYYPYAERSNPPLDLILTMIQLRALVQQDRILSDAEALKLKEFIFSQPEEFFVRTLETLEEELKIQLK